MPVFSSPRATVSHGPVALVTEYSTVTESTATLSLALQVTLCTLDASQLSPPTGEVRVTTGAATSTNVAVTALLGVG